MTLINSRNFVTARLNPNLLKWAIAISVALGAILEVIDTSIVRKSRGVLMLLHISLYKKKVD